MKGRKIGDANSGRKMKGGSGSGNRLKQEKTYRGPILEESKKHHGYDHKNVRKRRWGTVRAGM